MVWAGAKRRDEIPCFFCSHFCLFASGSGRKFRPRLCIYHIPSCVARLGADTAPVLCPSPSLLHLLNGCWDRRSCPAREVRKSNNTGPVKGSARAPFQRLHQLPRQHQKANVRTQAEQAQERDAVAARAELLDQPLVLGVGVRLGLAPAGPGPSPSSLPLLPVEELPVALVAAVDGDQHDGGAVDGEEGADGVELGVEDLEDDEGKGELRDGGAQVGALKGALGGADLDEPGELGSAMMLRRA